MDPKQHHHYLGIDYGKKRIGLAYASFPLYVSVPIGIIEAKRSLQETISALSQIVLQRKISCVVIGNPIPMHQHQTSPLTEDLQALATSLRTIENVEVILWDERLSSAQAERMLKMDCGLNRKQRKSKSDELAATLILASFLETLPNNPLF